MLRKTALTALMAALAAGTAGCTYLPASGPSARAIEAGAEVSTADGGLLARYEIVDVTPAVIEALRGRPLDSLLASFGDHRPSSEPVIGIGDQVAVSVWEAGSGGLFSGPLVADRFSAGSKSALIPEQPVGRDGAISVPYAGRIQVAGRRPQDVQALIENELAGKAIQPQVLVSVTRPISQAVTVAGEGAAGARLPLSGHGDRVLDVIAAAGGNRAPVSETFVRLSRGPLTATVPLTAVVSNPKENIYLRPNDVLTLVRDPQTFLAVGALGNATELPFQADGITLAQALAKARGLQDFTADPAGTFVFRFEPTSVVRRISPGSPFLAAGRAGAGPAGLGAGAGAGPALVPVVYRLDMRDPNSLFVSQGFRMRNRDLVYVSNAPFAEVTKALAAFTGITGPAASLATSYYYVK